MNHQGDNVAERIEALRIEAAAYEQHAAELRRYLNQRLAAAERGSRVTDLAEQRRRRRQR